MSGGHKYSERYQKYMGDKATDEDFTGYVDSKGNLSTAWNMIDDYYKKKDLSKYGSSNGLSPEQQVQYWIKRGVNSKSSFGRAHAAEQADLFEGNYRGATKYTKDSDAWKQLFSGKDTTDFLKYLEEGTDYKPPKPSDYGLDWSPLMTNEYTAPKLAESFQYMPTKNTGIWGSSNLPSLLYSPGTSDYDAEYDTSKYMNWGEVPVESGLVGYRPSPWGNLSLPEDWKDLVIGFDDKKKTETANGSEGSDVYHWNIDGANKSGTFMEYTSAARKGAKSGWIEQGSGD